MNFILFDDERAQHFLPLSHTRPVSEMRCGIRTIREKWEHILSVPPSYKCADHLKEHFDFAPTERNMLINAGIFPSHPLFATILEMQLGQVLMLNNILLAAYVDNESAKKFDLSEVILNNEVVQFKGEVKFLENLWDIFSLNDEQIRFDFEAMTRGQKSQELSKTNTLIGTDIFIEHGAKVEGAILNASTGPIYIGRDAEVMEGCMIRGPFSLGDRSVLKMGAKIYGATTIGPGCKVGGEINNSVFFANSNKAHDGFLGNAVIGEWCNLGADTNNSNLKNNYDEVKLWSEHKKSFVKTGLQFCGLIMGDHSKTGINTMLNTGTVIGVSCNIYGAGFPRNFIPSFSWGSAQKMSEYNFKKALITIDRVFQRRGKNISEDDILLLKHVHESTAEQRNY